MESSNKPFLVLNLCRWHHQTKKMLVKDTLDTGKGIPHFVKQPGATGKIDVGVGQPKRK